MKALKYLFLIFIAASSLVTVAHAQEDEQPDDVPQRRWQRRGNLPRDMQNNALRQLGLSNEQVRKIRKINIDSRPQMQAAQKQLREANQALDAAIYADVVNDADVESRLSVVNTAQSEVARIRFMNELAIRRVLNAEQLVRFREMRQEFEKRRQEFQQNREKGDRPFRRRPNSGGEARPD